MSSHLVSPLSRIFPKLGFHNRTIAELRANPSLRRQAVVVSIPAADIPISGEDRTQAVVKYPEVAFVPNILKEIKTEKEIVRTDLILVEISFSGSAWSYPDGSECIPEDLRHDLTNCLEVGKRAAYVVKKKSLGSDQKGKNITKYELYIYLNSDCFPRKLAIDAELVKSSMAAELELKKACERTFTFAVEFIGAYRGLACATFRQLTGQKLHGATEALSSFPKDLVFQPENASHNPPWDHPTSSDVFRLLCTYARIRQTIAITASDTGKDTPMTAEAYLNLAQTDFEERYFWYWSSEERIAKSIVEAKTWEYFLSELAPPLMPLA